MIGKFIGKTSMGFCSGEIYRLRSDFKVVRIGGRIFGENIMCLCVYDTNSDAWCPYQSLEALLKNWVICSPE